MGIFDGCLLVSDFDGTLYHDGVVPKANTDAIEYFKQKGGSFSIATGRGPYAARKAFRFVSINAPALLTNGSVIFDADKNCILDAVYLSDEVKLKTLEIIKEFPDIGIEVTLGDSIVTINENADTIAHRKSESFAEVLKSFDEIKNEPWIKVLMMSGDEHYLNSVKDYLNKNKPESCDYITTSPIFYEMLPKGINKACKIDKLLEITKCNRLFCIGDFYNDLEMVERAEIGAFCENSPKELKEKADYIAQDVKFGAVADFINYIEKYLK